MLYSSIDFENLIAYKTSQYRQEAANFRLARGARKNSSSLSYNRLLDEFGFLLVSLGRDLQRRAGRCLPREEFARPLHS